MLWHFPISHYNEKVRWALDFKGIPHRRRALGIGYMPRAWLASGQVKLPLLFLNGKTVTDSTRIIEALERFKPDPPLIPRRGGDRHRAIELERYLDETLGDTVRTVIIGPSFQEAPLATIRMLTTGMKRSSTVSMQMMYPLFRTFYRLRHGINRRTIEAAHHQLSQALNKLRGEVRPSGYLVSDYFTVADLTAAALLAPLAAPTELEYQPPEPLPPPFERVRQEFGGDPMFRWVREIYRRHRSPSAEVRA
jgi:glutathione S-transferase